MKNGKFAFCIHPIIYEDVTRKYPLIGKLPKSVIDRVLRLMPPSQISRITGVQSTFGVTEGWFVGVPLVTQQMISLPEPFVTNKIIQAGRLAEALGAKILGLGAFTSIVGDGGRTISKNLKIAVTTGNSYTVATAMEAIEEACRLLDRNIEDCSAVVVGATGSIGKVCAIMMATKAKNLTLVAPNKEKLENAAEEILKVTNKAVDTQTDIKYALKNADIVITVSSAVETIIEPDYLKSGAIVCDVARPRDVSAEVFEKRKDVLVIEGGVVEVPGDVNFHFNFGFPKRLSYACMAETMILALEERYEDYSIGKELSLEKVIEISQLAKKHGFKLSGFRSFERVVGNEYFMTIKENINGVNCIKNSKAF